MTCKCRIADIKVQFELEYERTVDSLSEFWDNFENPDLKLQISPEMFGLERKLFFGEHNINYHDKTLENNAAFRVLAEKTPSYNAVVFHSATFDVDGVGVAFAAHSGTGKTTHMMLWQKLLGDRMTIVNGDKPIVRFFEDEPEQPYAYGTPWNGKEKLGCNMRTPLKHICFIERSETNYVEKMEKKEAIDRIFNQVYMPKDPIAVMNTMQLIDRLLSCCNLWIIHCNMEMQAAKTAYEAVF
ncbi:MAG: hypothetical protein IJP34_05755 [Clostridia bacterium]|nr:hypothetical protein [Clostridia bacterium]